MTNISISATNVEPKTVRLIETLICTRKGQAFTMISLRQHLRELYNIHLAGYVASQILWDLANRDLLTVVGNVDGNLEYIVD